MKVENGETPEIFTPIIITIETKEEAALMYAKLNYTYKEIHRYARSQDRKLLKEVLVTEMYPNVENRMWSTFADVYGRSGSE